MKRKQHPNLLAAAFFCAGLASLFLAANTQGARKSDAQLTRIVQDVKLEVTPVPQTALLNQSVPAGVPVRTGANSWAELSFSNLIIARLAQQSLFGFDERAQMDLRAGAMLVQAPRAARRSRVKLGAISAEVTGATAVCEFRSGLYKFLVLQGTARLYRPGHFGDSILVHPGEMVFGRSDKALSDPVDVDIGRFAKTSRFLLDFAPLQTANLIARESERQQRSMTKKRLIGTNLVIFGGGTAVSLLAPNQSNTPAGAAGSEDLGSIEAPPAAPSPVAASGLRAIETSVSTGR